MLACLAMALAGFLTFGDRTEGNILNNFPTENVMVNVARLYVGCSQYWYDANWYQSFRFEYVDDVTSRSVQILPDLVTQLMRHQNASYVGKQFSPTTSQTSLSIRIFI